MGSLFSSGSIRRPVFPQSFSAESHVNRNRLLCLYLYLWFFYSFVSKFFFFSRGSFLRSPSWLVSAWRLNLLLWVSFPFCLRLGFSPKRSTFYNLKSEFVIWVWSILAITSLCLRKFSFFFVFEEDGFCVCNVVYSLEINRMGRVKLKIKKLENTIGRQTTFAKRKNGILKKANELSILCDIDIVLLMFSPTGKPALCCGRRR